MASDQQSQGADKCNLCGGQLQDQMSDAPRIDRFIRDMLMAPH